MRKTDKKRDKAIREVLTEACNIALERHEGFRWLTHFVNYDVFPESLCIVCVFETNEQLAAADVGDLRFLIKEKLSSVNVHLREAHRQVAFDSEENCQNEHDGKWNLRLG